MAKKGNSELVKARVLTSCMYGAPDDVAEMSEDDILTGMEAGLLDSNPDAVAYAEGLKAE